MGFYKFGDNEPGAERMTREEFASLCEMEPWDDTHGAVDAVLEALHRPAIDEELARMASEASETQGLAPVAPHGSAYDDALDDYATALVFGAAALRRV